MFRFVVHTHLIFLQNPRGSICKHNPEFQHALFIACGIQCLHCTCPIMPSSLRVFLLAHTHTHTRTHTHTDCPLDNTVRPLPCPCLGLPLFDNFICLFGYQQASRTQTLCLLYQSAVSRKLQPLVFAVCYFLES